MKIKVTVTPVANPTTSIVAFADVTLNEAMTVSGFKVINGKKGPFAASPSQKSQKTGEWYDSVKFHDEELGKQIKEKIMEAYEGTSSTPQGKVVKPEEAPESTPSTPAVGEGW